MKDEFWSEISVANRLLLAELRSLASVFQRLLWRKLTLKFV